MISRSFSIAKNIRNIYLTPLTNIPQIVIVNSMEGINMKDRTEKTIEVALLDKDGYSLGGGEFDSISRAKKYAKSMTRSQEDISAGLHKAEVRVNSECVADYFVK
jgi:hypothetical protein